MAYGIILYERLRTLLLVLFQLLPMVLIYHCTLITYWLRNASPWFRYIFIVLSLTGHSIRFIWMQLLISYVSLCGRYIFTLHFFRSFWTMCHNIVSPVNKCMITIILSSVSLLRLVLWSSPCSSKIIPSPFVQDFDASSSKASSPQSPSHSPNYDSMLHKEPKCIIITIININITIIIVIISLNTPLHKLY